MQWQHYTFIHTVYQPNMFYLLELCDNLWLFKLVKYVIKPDTGEWLESHILRLITTSHSQLRFLHLFIPLRKNSLGGMGSFVVVQTLLLIKLPGLLCFIKRMQQNNCFLV